MAGAPIQIPGVELLGELGHGTYSVVYRARKGDAFYAVKVPLRNETGIKLKLLGRRFRREAVALARLRHPLLPRVMEVGVVDRAPYIIMELATGETLAQRIQRGPIPEPEVIELGRQLGAVLRQVHESGLVHRDVKPKNIVFDSDTGQIRLVDFGFAASIDAAFRILEPVGTLEYAAPEQVSDLRQRVDGRADLYAVGCVLYECLTGSPPFRDLDPKRLLYQHGRHEIPDVREMAVNASGAIATVLKRLLARSPDDRYVNATALMHDLEHMNELGAGVLSTSAPGVGRAPSALVPMLGRGRELTRLKREWAAAETGEPRIVLLRGPTGSGKTRLAQALMDHVTGRGHKIVGAKCHAWDPRPFSAIREMVEGNILDLAPPDQAAVARRISSIAGDLAPLLKVLSPSLAGMLTDVAPVPQSQDAQHIFVEGLAEFLSKMFREVGPAMVFVDDLQWLDASSRRVVRRAIDRAAGSRILYVFAARGSEGEFEEADRFFHGLDIVEISVDELGHDDAADLVRAYLGDPAIDAEVVRAVSELSDGTPLSTLEILRMMLDDGQLLPSWGRWILDTNAAGTMKLPHSPLGILERRISSLDDMTRATLCAAAIAGMTFSDRMLPAICGLEEGHTTAALAEARRAMLVEADRNGTHRFVHDSVREVLLRSMTDEARRDANQKAAESLDGTFQTQVVASTSASSSRPSLSAGSLSDGGSARPSSVFVRGDPDADACYALANHYGRGVPGRTPLRVHASSVAAGRLAFDSFDNERALAFFQWAEDARAFLNLPLDPELGLVIAEAKLRVGFLERSREQFVNVLSASTDPLHQALALSRIAFIHQLQLDSARSWEALGRAFAKVGRRMPSAAVWPAIKSWLLWVWSGFISRVRVIDERERQRLEAVCSLYYQAVRLASVDENPLRIVESAFAGAVEAEKLGPSTSLARTYVTLSFVLTALGRRKTGRRYLRLAESVARSTADPVTIANALQVQTVVEAWEGNVKNSLEIGKRCLEEYGHWRELSEYCIVAYSQQELLEACGRSTEAWQWMQRVIDKVEHHDGDPFLIEVLELGARAALASVGREREADSILRKLRELTIRIPDNSGFKPWTYVPRIRLFTEVGDLGIEFEGLVEEFERRGMNPRRVHLGVTQFYLHLAHARVHALLRMPEAERAGSLEKLRRALRDFQRAARIPLLRAHALAIAAYQSMFVGDPEKAERQFAQAEGLGQKENAPWVLYAVHRGRAHLLRAQGRQEAARDQAKLAEAMAIEHGMFYRLQWIREEFGLVAPLQTEEGRPRFSRARSASSLLAGSPDSTNHLRTLLRLTEEAPGKVDASRQARAILDELVSRLNADRSYLLVATETPTQARGEGRALSLLVGVADGKEVSEADEVSRTMIEDAFRDWISTGAVGAYLLCSMEGRTMVAAPLLVDDLLVGALSVDRNLRKGPFGEADGEQLVTLAAQVPLALELARALSARQRVEAELQKAQELEAMGRLAEGVARDFGRVLSDLRASTDALLTSHVNGSGEKIRAIQSAAARAEELTQQLAAFSSGPGQNLELLSINDRIRRATSVLDEGLGQTLALSIRLAPGVHFVTADAAQIDHMIMTLAVRARDVTPHGGAVVIETSNALLDPSDLRGHPGAKAGSYVRISISDTGRAIEPSEQRQMFEPFAAEPGARGGFALGILYRNVVQSGGFIDIESIVGEGTTFRIYWPRASGSTDRALVRR